MSRKIIGVDIGGTTIKTGMMDEQGNVIKKWEIATNTFSADKIIEDIWTSIQTEMMKEALTEHDFLGIGAGSPGFIDDVNGMVYEAFNVGWVKYDLINQFKKHTRLPVFLGNDANMAALGENWKGAGNQAKNMIMVTLGTGVGSGIIANGELLTGENGMAGEIGHMTVDTHGHRCSCGRIGCVETICSATGIVRQAKAWTRKEPQSQLAHILKKDGAITAKDVFELAEAGDRGSFHIRQHTAERLGLAIANAATVINPAKVIIGGGVSRAGDDFLAEINTAFKKYALSGLSSVCELKLAQQGNDAGIIGAAFLVKQKTQNIAF